MDFAQVLDILRPQWEAGDWAKSSGELLWAHHFTVWSVGRKLAGYAPSVGPAEMFLLELACLTHDIGKRRKECQERLHQGHGPGDHKLHLDELADYFSKSLRGCLPVSAEQIQQIWDIARTHHSVSGTDVRVQTFGRAGVLGKLLISADWIASMEEPAFQTLARLQEFYEGRFGITYFQFSRFPSPSAYLVVKTAVEKYREGGWDPLVVFPQGAIFAAPAGIPYPSRTVVARAVEEDIIKQSLTLQKPLPTGYTGDFLTLLSRQYPDLFLASTQSQITDTLGTVDRALVFQKLARDILNARGLLAAAKEQCPVLGLVDSANSTSAHPKARERYRVLYKRPAPEKVNREMLDPLFFESQVRDVVPGDIPLPVEGTTPLRQLTAKQLFAILQALAAPPPPFPGPAPALSELQRYLYGCLLMEEDLDFTALAREIFERYKTYKQTSDAEKGVCERCACPVVGKMQPGLNFATAPQAFSQIKPKYQYRAICPLCGYDNLVVRRGVRGGKSRVYVRIETKVPDLLVNLPGLEALVRQLVSGVRWPRQLVRFEEHAELAQLPLPRRLPIPLSDRDEQPESSPVIPLNERGVLLILGETGSNRGPKDLRGEFEPVYHILGFLGFQVALGTEDQNGLFGEPVEVTRDNYIHSLAVVLLASAVDKKANRYVFASELIERSPSVALTYAAGDGREKFGLRKKFLELFLAYLVQATTKKGGMRMKHLLEDAAFLAPSLVDVDQKSDEEEPLGLEEEPEEATPPKKKRWGGIWSFCEHKREEKLNKHTTTKPISQALDELMLGRGIPVALNKFMQNLSVKIKASHAEELKFFVAGVRDILGRAEDLRQQNITDFLRYKNGLLSGVYMFTRYPDLKSVLVTKEN